MRVFRLVVAIFLGLGLTLILQWGFSPKSVSVVQAAPPISPLAFPVNSAPVVGVNDVLYDGSLGTGLPQTQGFIYLTDPFFGASAAASFANGVTTLDTTPDQIDKAGYFRNFPFPQGSPILNRATGYTVRFSAQIVSEAHANNNRAGFSLIALSSDLQGVEIGFWENEIWIQEGGTPPNLFTHAEGATFDTTTGLIPYELTILGDDYSLSVSNTLILSGSLRNYSDFGAPYTTQNFIFLGDDTTSAQAEFKLSYVSVLTNIVPPDQTATAGTPLVINNLGGFDVDAWGDDVVLTITVNSGTLSVSDSVANGLNSGQISGNGTSEVVVTAPLGTINSTLAFSPSLTYTANISFGGVDTATVTINDQGNNGTGSALSDTKTFQINVSGTATDLAINKTVTPTTAAPGDTITYTLTFSNAGAGTATGVVITDEIPITVTHGTLSVNNSVTITPTGGVTYAWEIQDLASGDEGIITITGILSDPLPTGTFTNTAEITTTSVDGDTGNNTASVGLQVGGWVINEIHADPISSIAGDANGDGVRDANDDEFVELINNTGNSVDISGWTLTDLVGPAFVFPSGTVVPQGCAVVVFGGGTPTGEFGGAFVFADSGSLGGGLNNTGDTVTLTDGSQDVVSYAYGNEGNHDESLTRNPDVTGTDPLVRHNTQTSASTLYSPGTQLDGTPFAANCAQADLGLTKTVASASGTPGQTIITYTLTYTNVGPNPATGIVITDAQPEISTLAPVLLISSTNSSWLLWRVPSPLASPAELSGSA